MKIAFSGFRLWRPGLSDAVISWIEYLTKRKSETVDYDAIVVVIGAADVMDMDGICDLRILIKTLVAGGVRKIAIDMEMLIFIDSAGIAALIEAAKLLRQERGDIVLLRVPPRIKTIFQPVRLNRFISCFESEGEMRAFFNYI